VQIAFAVLPRRRTRLDPLLWRDLMPRNSVVTLIFLVALAMARIDALAQTQRTVSRGQVECELRALEGAGYRPWENDYYYPRDLQAAQARLAQQERERGLPPGGTCIDITSGSGAEKRKGRETGD
jgi:hypothetical protein